MAIKKLRNIVNGASDLFSLHGSFDTLNGGFSQNGDEYVFQSNTLVATATFTHHPSGVVKRCDRVTNVSDQALSLRSALSKFVFNGGEYEVYSQYSMWCCERYGAWQSLVTEICASNDEIRHNSCSNPFVAIYNLQNGKGVAFHILCDSKWRYRVRRYYTNMGNRKAITVELGLDDSDLDYQLAPGESLELPPILCYEFENKIDLDAYKLHRYCNDLLPRRSLPIIYNSWMSRFDEISYDLLSEQLEMAKKIGAEYFVIDAGWFGRPIVWYESVGDWEECTDYSMCGRMKKFGDKVRAEGLKLGLWFEIERAALTSRSYQEHPDYYIVDNGQAFVDFGNEEACRYVLDILSKHIETYGLEFIKFDFNACLTYDKEKTSFVRYFKGYQRFIRSLRERFPSLYLENCASGGLRMAMAALEGFDSFWMSDNHSLYRQLEVFKAAVRRLPPSALEKWITVRSLAPFEPVYGGGVTEKILVSGDACWDHIEAVNEGFMKAVSVGGPIGITCDLTKLSSQLLETLADFIRQYKEERDFWIRTECRILCDTESLTVLQYSDEAFGKLKILTFSQEPVQNAVTVYPFIEGDGEYQDEKGCRYTADVLGSEGLDLPIGNRMTANMITLTRI